MKNQKPVVEVSVERAAEIHKCTTRRIQVLAKEGRIVGAKMLSGVWIIPLPLTIVPAGRLRPRSPGPVARKKKA